MVITPIAPAPLNAQAQTPTAQPPSLLEIASRLNSTHLDQLEKALALSLQTGRNFTRPRGLPDVWDQEWQTHWDNIEKIMDRTRTQMNQMVEALESRAGDHLQRAMTAWEAIQCEGDFLQHALAQVREQANQFNAVDREKWNTLARTLEHELEGIHYFAQALRLKLELLKDHSHEEAERGVRSIVSQFPRRQPKPGPEGGLYDHEYRRATLQLEQEHHEFLGYMDVVKALLMWEETPEERMTRNRSLQVQPA